MITEVFHQTSKYPEKNIKEAQTRGKRRCGKRLSRRLSPQGRLRALRKKDKGKGSEGHPG